MSKTGDDIFRQIREEIARRGKEPASLDELHEIAAEVTARYNCTALADFEGLSPEQKAFHCFNYRVFDKGLYLFGLIEMEYTGSDIFTRKKWIKTTGLLHQVFDII